MKSATNNTTFIRWSTRRDMSQVLQIDRKAFATWAWTEEDFLNCLRQRNCVMMVAEDFKTDLIKGFMIYELHRDRVKLLNLAVDPQHSRQGVGSQLVEKLKYKVTSHNRPKATLTVRETNLETMRFFAGRQFRATGFARGAYPEEDGVSFEWASPEHDPLKGWGGVIATNRIATYLEEH